MNSRLKKMEIQRNEIKHKILNLLYSNILKNSIFLDFKEIFPNFDKNIVRDALQEIDDLGFLINYSQIYYDSAHAKLSDLGLIEWEKDKKKKPYTEEIIKFLLIIEKSEEKILTKDLIIKKMINNNSILQTEEEIYTFIRDTIGATCDVQKMGDKELEVFNNIKAISWYGQQLLQNYYRKKKLFLRTSKESQSLIFEWYNTLESGIINYDWRIAFISMGVILEECINCWADKHHIRKFKIESSNEIIKKIKWRKAKFQQKLLFIIQTGAQKYNDIGKEFDWDIINTILRPIRNYVHIRTEIKKKVVVEKHQFDSLYVIFEKLIEYF